MGMCDQMTKKLAQATCDKIEWNRRILRIRKCFKEAEQTICGGKKKKDKK